jgi:hypothetical protein
MPDKNFNFYLEIVVVTVLSLVAANAWTKILYEVLDRYYPNSITTTLIIAIAITAIAIGILYLAFSKKDSPYLEMGYPSKTQIEKYREEEDSSPTHHGFRSIYLNGN